MLLRWFIGTQRYRVTQKKKYTTRIRNEDIFKKNYACFYVLVQFSFHFNSNLFRSPLLPEIKNKTQKSVFVITQIKEKKIKESLCVITKLKIKLRKVSVS